MKIISILHTMMLYPMSRSIVELQSQAQRLKTLREATTCHIECPYEGQPIVLIALYQKGVLRPDLVRFLRVAKAQGLYVLAVNTLRLSDPAALTGLVDCYVERPNYGRDFGSYKAGFEHFFARNWQATCPRLLMVNDSVFYSTRGLDEFVEDLTTTTVEVLGATENYEIEYHLGSFCISMAQNVLTAPRFRTYWDRYRLTDVRPIVIKQGEMKFSRILKRCVSCPSQFHALYNTDRFLNEMKARPEIQDLILRDSRTGDNTPAPRFDVSNVTKLLSGHRILPRYSNASNIEVALDAPIKDFHEDALIMSRNDLARYLLRHVPENARSKDFDELLGDSLSAVASEVFMFGSQIHQNAGILLELGLPIVKLDGLYRGMLNSYDVLRLQKKLDAVEACELSALLLERPYGGHMLVGWKHAAFMRGLI